MIIILLLKCPLTELSAYVEKRPHTGLFYSTSGLRRMFSAPAAPHNKTSAHPPQPQWRQGRDITSDISFQNKFTVDCKLFSFQTFFLYVFIVVFIILFYQYFLFTFYFDILMHQTSGGNLVLPQLWQWRLAYIYKTIYTYPNFRFKYIMKIQVYL